MDSHGRCEGRGPGDLKRDLLVFAACAAAIFLSGAQLPRLGKSIAERLGIAATTFGLFVLAVVTSLPELTITLSAMISENAPDLALANVLGSNNFNLTIIAALDLLFVGGSILQAVHARRYTRTCVLVLTTTLVTGLGVLLGARLQGGAGEATGALAPVALFSLPVVIIFVYDVMKGRRVDTDGGRGDAEPAATGALPGLATRFLLLSAVVVAAGLFMAKAADGIATHKIVLSGSEFTLGHTFIGTLLVAVATSLPEVTVAFAAVKYTRSADMAVGTLLGSNTFNLLIFSLGAPLLILKTGSSGWASVGPQNQINVIAAIVLTVIVLVGIRLDKARTAVWVPRALALTMAPVYLVTLYLVYRASTG